MVCSSVDMWNLLPTLLLAALLATLWWRHQRAIGQQHQKLLHLLGSQGKTLLPNLAYFWHHSAARTHEPLYRAASPANRSTQQNPPASTPRQHYINGIHRSDKKIYDHYLEKLGADAHAVVEYRRQTSDNQWSWYREICLTLDRTPEGRPAQQLGLVLDITRERHLAATLSRAQSVLDHIEHAGEIGGWEYDCPNDVLHWTPQTYRLHDLTAGEDKPTLYSAIEYFNPCDQPAARDAIDKAVSEHKPFDLELELITARSKLRWIRFTGRASTDTLRGKLVHGSYQDITQAKQAEFEKQKLQLKMLETQKLESIGVLAGGIAHDFNNLLTVIISHNAIAREDPAGSLSNLGHIDAAAHRAADLCRQMLSYVSHTPFDLALVELNSLVSETLQLLQLSIRKNAILQLDPSPEFLLTDADATQLRQVLMNLVINASDAIGDRPGHILVSTKNTHHDAASLARSRTTNKPQPGSYHTITVSDNGGGMSPETLSKIFDPFFTTKYSGRGLGLAAVQGIIRSHHGALFVESTPGVGTAFTILLPVSQSHTAPRETATPLSPTAAVTLQNRHIVIVDDEVFIREVAENFLRRRGSTTVTASEGHQALSLIRRSPRPIDIVILDQTMPGLNGYDTLLELRRTHPTLPVLAVSGYTTTSREEFRKIPHTDFLAKPYDQADLERALIKLLSNAASSSSNN